MSSQSPYETIGYAAYKSLRNDEPANVVDGLYYSLYMIALGLQLAGPNLTPASFEKGMFTFKNKLGPAGPVGLRTGRLHDDGRLPRDLLGSERDLEVQLEARRVGRSPTGQALRPRRQPDGVRPAEHQAPAVTRLRAIPKAWIVAAIPFLYALAYVLPGLGPKLERNAPVGVVAIGVIYGTVTALGAMALILTYRSNRFVNFAYGSMGSLVGVLAIGLYREHGVPYFVVLPLGVAVGVMAGGLVEFVVLRRFRNASRPRAHRRQHRPRPAARWA